MKFCLEIWLHDLPGWDPYLVMDPWLADLVGRGEVRDHLVLPHEEDRFGGRLDESLDKL